MTTSTAGIEVIRSGNALRDLNPATQMSWCLVLAVIALLFGWTSILAVVALCFVLALLAGRLGAFALTWARTVLVVCLVITTLQTIFIPGETAWVSWGPISLTQEGFERGMFFAGRILGAGTALVLLTQLVQLRRLVRDMEQRNVSPKVSYVVVATVNLLPAMRVRLDLIMDAQRARGVETDGSWFIRAKAFFPALGPLLISSIVGVEEKAMTLEARAFTATGPRTSLSAVDDGGAHRVLRWLSLIVLLAAIAAKVVLWQTS